MDLEKAGRALEQALALSGSERAAYIKELAASDAELAVDVERLLADEDDAFLQQPIARSLDALRGESSEPWLGREVGAYKITGQIAAGGMGQVFSGNRFDGEFEQAVAIKVMGGALHSATAVARFQAERQILANLSHPYIAQLIDGGTTEDHQSYLVMELIEGESIDVYCERVQLTLRDRLCLFQRVCEAVDHAHRNLVVHRDIKPSNILVTRDGTPKLLDFGIAKLIEPDAESRQLTQHFERALTLEFASPEQVRAEPVTTASDVYSLGVLLYRLLTGVSPYDVTSDSTLVDQICEVDPQRPSRRETDMNTSEASVRTEQTLGSQRWRRRLAGDLDNVVLKAMRKEPARRYSSVQRLSDDIDRYLSHRPVQARRNTLTYIAGRFIRRNALAVGASVALVSMLAVFAVQTAMQNAVIASERDTATAVADFLVDTYEMARPEVEPGVDVPARKVLDAGRGRIEERDDLAPATRGRLLQVMGDAYNSLGLYPEAISSYELALETGEFATDRHSEILYSLAKTYSHVGDLDQADEFYAQADREFAKLSNPGLVTQIDTLLAHAAHHGASGRPSDSLAMLLDAKSLAEGLDDDPDGLLPLVLHNLGAAYFGMDRLDDAQRLWEQVLKHPHPDWQRDSRQRALTTGALADVYRRRGASEQALPYAEEALRILRLVYGDDHQLVGVTHNKIGMVLGHLQRFDEAHQNIDRGLEISIATLGKDSYKHAIALGIKARLFENAGNVDEALNYYRRSLEVKEKLLPAGHERFGVTYQRLGSSLRALGNLDESRSWLNRALDLFVDTYGEQNIKVADTLRELGTTELEAGDFGQAEAFYTRAIAAYGDSPSLVLASTEAAMARLFVLTGRCALAREQFESVEERYRQEGQPLHPRLEPVRDVVAQCTG
ncbi:MAG: tetratricopeptide repeat protein [Gammaproteobacteria bacterium]